MNSICTICGKTFEARHSYGLCAFCFSHDRAREFDRWRSTTKALQRKGVNPINLTLLEWLSTISDHAGQCAYCGEYQCSIIEMARPDQGFTVNNVVPCCRACHARRSEGYETAEYRVKQYLDIDRVQHNITHNEECEEPA